jgi:hypothetical protein
VLKERVSFVIGSALNPGEPRERQVIAPDWAELEKRQHKRDKPVSARAIRKLPANKRGRG